jgi:hypothetical protein
MQNTKLYAVFMISVILAGIFSLSPVIASLFNSATIRSSGTITTILPLHVEGKYIKDSLGRAVILRGMNHGTAFVDDPDGWWNPEGGGYLSGNGVWNPNAVKYNLDKMREWGINVLRIHTVIQWWLDDTSNYKQHIKDTITWAGERGIYVIFEPCYVRGYPDSYQYELPCYPYLIEDEVVNPPEDVAIMPNRTAFINYWRSVANELKSYPNMLFEIYNEPHGDDTVKNEFFQMTQEWINAIRATGATQILVVQWDYGIWCNLDYPPPANPATTMDWVEKYPLNDPLGSIVYSFHNYRGDFHRTIPSYYPVWTYEDIKEALQICLVDYVLNNLSKPVICGEIGANMWKTGDDLAQEIAWLNNTLSIFNEWKTGYMYYSWTIPAHMQHGCLSNGYVWLPPPNEAGITLINSLAQT